MQRSASPATAPVPTHRPPYRLRGSGSERLRRPRAAAETRDGFGLWGHAEHAHGEDQFVMALAGAATIEAEQGSFPLSVDRGVWIPAGVRHSATFDPGFAPFVHGTGTPTGLAEQTRSVRVDAELRERLIATTFDEPFPADLLGEAVRAADPSASAIVRFAHIELTHPIAREIGRALREDPADDRSLDDWASRLHTSAATIRRAFRRDVGASFSTWRTAVRLEVSESLLRRGCPVAAVARAVGLSHNGLLAAFRRHYGIAPSDLR